MVKRVLQLFFAGMGIFLGYRFVPDLFRVAFHIAYSPLNTRWFGALLGGGICALGTIWLVNYLMALIKWIEVRLQKLPLAYVIGGGTGMILGLLIGYLLAPEFRMVPLVGLPMQFFVSFLLAYLGVRVGVKNRADLLFLIAGRRTVKKPEQEQKIGYQPGEAKLLDTSVIIDGRIADLVKSGFLDGVLVIPSFVLEELQFIADSSDALKRNRGRRGLDVLNQVQKEERVKVDVMQIDFDDISEVDSKLVRLAKQLQGKLVTNDYNLNKVCELQGVSVLNVNDLANALKSMLLPGEDMTVKVIREGKEQNQGVGYLDDGTMIIVEDGLGFIGTTVEVLITAVRQTAAGRMIFTKLKASSANEDLPTS